jgi:thioredoxin reductase (NADPH)
MSAPVFLIVDDDRDTLRDVTGQLTRRYDRDYRIKAAGEAGEAVAILESLADADEEVAIVLVAQSPDGADDDGDDVLQRTRQLHPHAKRALVVGQLALADAPTSQAIRDAMALGRVDYYVQRPVGPLDEVFQHAIATFVLEWASEQRRVPQTVHIIGEQWSGRAHELRETFERCAAPHTFCLADSAEGRALLEQAGPEVRLPAMLLPGGEVLADPSNAEIARAAGTPADFDERDFDIVIVGAGPAGLSAAVYGASEGLRTLVIDDGGIGGQARSSSLIRNYLGFPRGVSGSRLAEQAYEQARVFGATFVFMNPATALEPLGGGFAVTLSDGRRVEASVVLLATGATYRRLAVPALEALTGSGVFYGGPAAIAPAFSGRDVFVAGGGNSAGQAVLHLARYARRATLLVRGASLEAGMSRYLTQEIAADPQVEVRLNTSVVGGGGDGRLETLVLRDAATATDQTVAADALFALIGARPHTGWLPSFVARDPDGFVYTGEDVPRAEVHHEPAPLETSMPRLLAAGDVRHGSVKRVASAVGEGSVAVQIVHRLLAAGPRVADVARS